MTSQPASTSFKSDVSQAILNAVEDLRLGSGFGSVEVVVHEGRVTQIEIREKLRFNQKNGSNSPTVPTVEK